MHEKLRLVAHHAWDLFLDGVGAVIFLLIYSLRQRLRATSVKYLEVQKPITKENEMENKELLSGSEHEVEMEFKEGKIALIGKYAGKGGGADVKLYANADYFFDKLAEKIPGQVDDAIFAVLKQAVKLL